MFKILNMNMKYKKEVFALGKMLFREEDEIPCLKKSLKNCVNRLSYIIIDTMDKNKVIGFCIICKKKTIINEFKISFFGIHPFYQGKGLGSQCLRLTLLSLYNFCNFFNCFLDVDISNILSIKLYEKFGFIYHKTIKHDKYPYYVMKLNYKNYKLLNSL